VSHFLRARQRILAAVLPDIVQRVQHLREAGHAVARLGREVRAAVERLAPRRQKDGHRPAAVASHRLDGVHVDRVDVGPLFAIDLDVDESLVHESRGRLVLEAFMLHDVAPVARRIADAQQDRLVFGARSGQRFLAPGIPVHRIVGMLQQIWTGFVDQAVGLALIAHESYP
jgi:hypothetical protein